MTKLYGVKWLLLAIGFAVSINSFAETNYTQGEASEATGYVAVPADSPGQTNYMQNTNGYHNASKAKQSSSISAKQLHNQIVPPWSVSK